MHLHHSFVDGGVVIEYGNDIDSGCCVGEDQAAVVPAFFTDGGSQYGCFAVGVYHADVYQSVGGQEIIQYQFIAHRIGEWLQFETDLIVAYRHHRAVDEVPVPVQDLQPVETDACWPFKIRIAIDRFPVFVVIGYIRQFAEVYAIIAFLQFKMIDVVTGYQGPVQFRIVADDLAFEFLEVHVEDDPAINVLALLLYEQLGLLRLAGVVATTVR